MIPGPASDSRDAGSHSHPESPGRGPPLTADELGQNVPPVASGRVARAVQGEHRRPRTGERVGQIRTRLVRQL